MKNPVVYAFVFLDFRCADLNIEATLGNYYGTILDIL